MAHSKILVNWNTAALATANTAKDGTGTANYIFGPDILDSYVDRIVCRAAGTNVATVIRVFINNGGDNAVAANNVLFTEKTLAATTLDEAAAFADNNITLDLWLPRGYRLFVLLGTTVASGYYVTAVAGEYQYA